MSVASGFSLSVLQRNWLSTHVTGTTPATPMNELKKRYYQSQIGGSAANNNDLVDLEKIWLRKDISDNGGTPNGSKLSDLWKQCLAARGLRVSNFMDENKQTFFRNVA